LELENNLQKAAEELSRLRVTAVEWEDEKEKLSAQYEQLNQDVKVCMLLLENILFVPRILNVFAALLWVTVRLSGLPKKTFANPLRCTFGTNE